MAAIASTRCIYLLKSASSPKPLRTFSTKSWLAMCMRPTPTRSKRPHARVAASSGRAPRELGRLLVVEQIGEHLHIQADAATGHHRRVSQAIRPLGDGPFRMRALRPLGLSKRREETLNRSMPAARSNVNIPAALRDSHATAAP